MTLAIFDLDNTLIDGDSDHAWGEFIVENGLVDSASYRQKNDWFYRQYQEGNLDIDAYLKFSLEHLAGRSESDLAELRQQFIRERIEPMRLPAANILLNNHRANGDYLLIITSTNLFITEPIAELLGVDEILATIPEQIDGVYTGKVDGAPCFREGKISHLKRWLRPRDYSLADSYFYSDSINDLALLEYVGHPVAVDPDEQLAETAKSRGWPVIHLHRS